MDVTRDVVDPAGVVWICIEQAGAMRDRIYILLRDLNSAGRRAIRAGQVTRQPPYYRFNHHRRPPRPAPTPDTPA